MANAVAVPRGARAGQRRRAAEVRAIRGAVLRRELETAIEAAIELLDQIDGDADLEHDPAEY